MFSHAAMRWNSCELYGKRFLHGTILHNIEIRLCGIFTKIEKVFGKTVAIPAKVIVVYYGAMLLNLARLYNLILTRLYSKCFSQN